jgi:hypothetical protein
MTGDPEDDRGDADDVHILEITYEVAMSSLEQVISPSLAEFLELDTD